MRYSLRMFGGHLLVSVSFILLLIVAGTVGFMHLESIGPMEAFYHTVISITTVGYADIATGRESRLFTVALVLAGVAAFYYLAGSIAATLVSGRIFEVLKLRKMEDELARAKDHVILCGYGQVGSLIAEKLKGVIVVERDEGRFGLLVDRGFLGVHGDSTHPETLQKAGVERAKAMLIALDSDPEVVYTILTAMEANPAIKVYARANEIPSVKKMKKAGAQYVICLPEIGSRDLLSALEGKEGCIGELGAK